jgi:cyclopropane fatty-acyl-phospholipid synthase-like methyltransferase
MYSLLRVRGLLLNHAITRRARRKNFRRKPPTYVAMTRYIFPGGELDHIGLSLDNLEIHEFDVHDVEGLREHYAKTCRIWAERLYDRRKEAEAMIGEVKTDLSDARLQTRARRLGLAADAGSPVRSGGQPAAGSEPHRRNRRKMIRIDEP